MRRLRNTFDVNIWVNFSVHFVNSACAFVDHSGRHTTIIPLVQGNDHLQYHPFDIRQAYINDYSNLSMNFIDHSSHSLHSVDSDELNVLNSQRIKSPLNGNNVNINNKEANLYGTKTLHLVEPFNDVIIE